MPLSTTTTFTCDRDGTIAESTSDAATANPPVGWARLMMDEFAQGAGGGVSPPVHGHLCPACVAAFREFMGPPAFAAPAEPTKEGTSP